MGSPEKISDRDSFTFVRRNDHGILSKLRQSAERGGTVLHKLRRAHCRSCAAVCAAQSRAAVASSEPPARSGSIAAGAAAAVGGVLGGMGGQPQQPSALEPSPQAPYQTATLPYQPDPHGGAQGGPQAQRAEIKEMFFTVQGRLNRKPFLLRGLVLGILSLILSSVMGGLAETSSTVLHLVSLLMLPLILVCAAGSLTLIIRRWHDLGKSGWFTLLLLIPLLNFLVMLYLWFVRGTAGPNAYGEDPLG